MGKYEVLVMKYKSKDGTEKEVEFFIPKSFLQKPEIEQNIFAVNFGYLVKDMENENE